jgi:TetR/AcrR family transcriptional regulator
VVKATSGGAPSVTTRDRILESALTLFAGTSFDGVSIRDIERHAGVERGLLAYHFGSKQALWRDVVDAVFDPFVEELSAASQALQDVSARERARALRKAYVRFNARRPEFFRLLVLEGMVRTERTEHLEEKLRQGTSLSMEMRGETTADLSDVIMRFLLIAASAAPFVFPAFRELSVDARELGGGATSTDVLLEPYAEAIANLRIGPPSPRGTDEAQA